MSQRDVIIQKIFAKACIDRDIVFLSVDFGAPALDQFREQLPSQFIHVGISEQNAIDLAAGLAMGGKKVFVYGMAPFISMRCLEQIKMSLAQMSLPVVILSVGVGLGYADSGPTHYATEDLGALRSIINLDIYTISNSEQASSVATFVLDQEHKKPIFIRLDREVTKTKPQKLSNENLLNGFVKVSDENDHNLVIASGYSLALAVQALEGDSNKFSLIDWFRIKTFPEGLIEEIQKYEKVLFIDEQTAYSSNFGLLLAEINRLRPQLLKKIEFTEMNLSEVYFYDNGGRKHLHSTVDFTAEKILKIFDCKA
jgi:transketolase